MADQPASSPSPNSTLMTTDVQNTNQSESTWISSISGTLSSVAMLPITTSLGRKFTYVGALYMAGGAIVSTVGLTPVLVTGLVVWFT